MESIKYSSEKCKVTIFGEEYQCGLVRVTVIGLLLVCVVWGLLCSRNTQPKHRVHNTQGNQYIETYPGTLNVIVSAPHGGQVRPRDVPSRRAGCWDDGEQECVWAYGCGEQDYERCKASRYSDMQTAELAFSLRNDLFAETGEYPSLVINNLHRSRMDANRDRPEATFGDPVATATWEEFHRAIDGFSAGIDGPGLYLDIHGQTRSDYMEIGYLISGEQLDSDDFDGDETSIRRLASRTDLPFEELLRGNTSFGAIIERHGFGAIPSPGHPGPDGEIFFAGAYNVGRHGSLTSGQIDGIQLETSIPTRSWDNHVKFSRALAKTVKTYLELHYPDRRKSGAYHIATSSAPYFLLLLISGALIIVLLKSTVGKYWSSEYA